MYEIVEICGQTPRGVGTFWHCAWDTFEQACEDAAKMARHDGAAGGFLIVRPDGENPGPPRHAYF